MSPIVTLEFQYLFGIKRITKRPDWLTFARILTSIRRCSHLILLCDER